MPKKSFSIYCSDEDLQVNINDQLIIEVGKLHLACIYSKEGERSLAAVELFTFSEAEAADFGKLFADIGSDSKILEKSYVTKQAYINNEISLLVPIFKFNKEIAADYLNIVYGEDGQHKVVYEYLPIEKGIISVFRVREDIYQVINQQLPKVTFRHTYSNIVRTLEARAATFPSELISIQFYNTSFIAVVMKDKNVQVVQSFAYETPEDVLYHLLNLTQRFELFSEDLRLQISGMIDLEFQLYRELIKYFKHVNVEQVDANNLLLDIKDHPVHYFTPFFNLAL